MQYARKLEQALLEHEIDGLSLSGRIVKELLEGQRTAHALTYSTVT